MMGGQSVRVPNPVTWSIMKLVAMRDQRVVSENPGNSVESRGFALSQAQKHAQDVCRIVAMTTRDESEDVASVVHAIRKTAAFVSAADIFGRFFRNDDAWGVRAVGSLWNRGDFQTLRSVLSSWLG